MRIWWQNSSEESGFDLRRSSQDLEKKEKNWKKNLFSIYFTWMNSSIFEWNLHGSKAKQNFSKWKKFSRLKKFETLYLFQDIVLILRHCTYFETLYLFRDIVFISRHCIYFETLYLFWDIVFNSRYCIISRHSSYFETAQLFALSIRARRASTSVPRAESRSRRRRFSRPERRKKV